jgi:hypothetical protein
MKKRNFLVNVSIASAALLASQPTLANKMADQKMQKIQTSASATMQQSKDLELLMIRSVQNEALLKLAGHSSHSSHSSHGSHSSHSSGQ